MRQFEKYKLNDYCARAHAQFFLLGKKCHSLHDLSCKFCPNALHAQTFMKYHAYFIFCKDKLECMLKIKAILTHMKDLNVEM